MAWTADNARTIGLPLSAAGIRFTLWNYECAVAEDRLAINETHVISMLLSGSSEARVRHGLACGNYSAFGLLGSLLMAPAGVPLHTVGAPIRTKVARLEITPGRYGPLDDLIAQLQPKHLERCRSIDSHAIREGMRRLALESTAPGLSADLLLEGVCSTLVVELVRYLNILPPTGRRSREFSGSHVLLVSDYIEANLDRRITTSELAELCGLSARHFTRRFAESTGQSVRQFIEQAKLRHSQILLSDPDISIKEVAYRMGFASHANFSDSFLRQCGERPGVFRQRQFGNTA